MNKIIDKNGKIHEFETLTYKQENLIKLRLHVDNDDVEGIWAVVSDKDKELLDKDTSGDYFIAALCNDALAFYPNRSWGLHLLCKTNGKNRPECDREWVDYMIDDNRTFIDVPEQDEDDEEV